MITPVKHSRMSGPISGTVTEMTTKTRFVTHVRKVAASTNPAFAPRKLQPGRQALAKPQSSGSRASTFASQFASSPPDSPPGGAR